LKTEEKIYVCEVKKLFVRDGKKRLGWAMKSVSDAIREDVTEYRCKECHGAVKLHGKNLADGPTPHIEHKSRLDSEFCAAGLLFRDHPGREPRLSSMPVL
jgi:hypothetical protein